MNIAKLIVIMTLGVMASSPALAFITVIDIKEQTGVTKTIQSGSDYSFDQLTGKNLSYRGKGTEAAALFKSLVHNELAEQLANVEFEINEETGTVAITVSVSGYFGPQYYYYILKQGGA